MNLLKKLMEYCFNKLFDIAFSSISLASLYIGFKNLFNLFKHLLINHMGLTMISLAVGWTFALYFGLIVFLNNRKKLINHLLVDNKGRSFCPACTSYLHIMGADTFYCGKCQRSLYPIMNNGHRVNATDFAAIQQTHPQTIVTPHSYDQRTLEQIIRKRIALTSSHF